MQKERIAMLKEKKKMILTAVLMTAALGLSQGALAQETEALEENTLMIAQETTQNLRPHPIVRSSTLTDEEFQDPEDSESFVRYAEMHYPRVYLPTDEAEAFPDLNQSLSDYYDEVESEKQEHYKEMQESAHERRDAMAQDGQTEYWTYFSNTETASIVRADDRVLSIRSDFNTYEGGAHGYYSRYGVTFDTQTGKKLSFTDVVKDSAKAAAYTFEKLSQRYPELESFLSQKDVAQYYQDDSDSFSWTLEPEGMMIYFPPYVLASYAEGMQAVLLSYDEYPDLFVSQYVSDSDKWIVPLDSLYGVLTDPGRGISEISVSGTRNENGTYTDRIITVDGIPYTFGEGSLYYYGMNAYLICSADRLWLWCLDSIENDYEELHIYSLEGGEPSDTEYSDIFSSLTIDFSWEETQSYSDCTTLTDPAAIRLSQRMRGLGTYSASKEYFVSGSGTPVSEDLFFTPDTERTLTLKVPVSLKMVGQDGTGELMKEWPAGTTCTILRTDGNQIVDLVMDNDETQVARIASDFSRWPHYIYDMEESDLFDGGMYAG